MKKTGKVLLILLCCLLAAAGGIYAYARYTDSRPVPTVRAGDYMLSYIPSGSYLYGIVASGESETVVLSKEQRLASIHVKKGDAVKKGDKLLTYDLSRTELSIEEKELEREKLLLEIEEKRRDYKKFTGDEYPLTITTPSPTPGPAEPKNLGSSAAAGTQISRLGYFAKQIRYLNGDGLSQPYRYEFSDTDEITYDGYLSRLSEQAASQGKPVTAVFSGKSAEVTVIADTGGAFSFYISVSGASGSSDLKNHVGSGAARIDPMIFQYGSGMPVSSEFISDKLALARRADLYVALKNNRFTAYFTFRRNGSFSVQLSMRSVPTPTPTPTPAPSSTPGPTETPYYGGGMSRAEREAMAAEYRLELREKENEFRQLELDIRSLRTAAETPVLYAGTDGIVTEAAESPASAQEGDVVLVIRAGDEVYISCLVAELEREKYPAGTVLSGLDYETGNRYSCAVREIGVMPVMENYDNGYGTNSSAYVMKLDILGNTAPSVGAFIDFSAGDTMLEDGVVYLHEAFIGSEDGRDCVYAVRDGLVKREYVSAGRRVDAYVELTGCSLSRDDRIVFPGERNCRDGARAKLG